MAEVHTMVVDTMVELYTVVVIPAVHVVASPVVGDSMEAEAHSAVAVHQEVFKI